MMVIESYWISKADNTKLHVNKRLTMAVEYGQSGGQRSLMEENDVDSLRPTSCSLSMQPTSPTIRSTVLSFFVKTSSLLTPVAYLVAQLSSHE